jgi:hypothetical protein
MPKLDGDFSEFVCIELRRQRVAVGLDLPAYDIRQGQALGFGEIVLEHGNRPAWVAGDVDYFAARSSVSRQIRSRVTLRPETP